MKGCSWSTCSCSEITESDFQLSRPAIGRRVLTWRTCSRRVFWWSIQMEEVAVSCEHWDILWLLFPPGQSDLKSRRSHSQWIRLDPRDTNTPSSSQILFYSCQLNYTATVTFKTFLMSEHEKSYYSQRTVCIDFHRSQTVLSDLHPD